MNKEALDRMLERHRAWLHDPGKGICANLRGEDLSGANLFCADLRGATLFDATLQGADLRGANLLHADLQDADLRGANLQHANLLHADLQGADLQGADLRYADLWGANHAPITMHIGPWDILIHNQKMRVGCEIHSFDEWRNFTDDEISEMDDRALEFWNENKELLFAACAAYERKNKGDRP